MSLKDKLLNKVADYLYKYKSDDLNDKKSFWINVIKKDAYITNDCEYIKENKDKLESGLIDIEEFLKNEKNDGALTDIVFCDNGKILCLPKGMIYVETSHEFFDMAREYVYMIFRDEKEYMALKSYLANSKWNDRLVYSDDIPQKQGFEKLFNIGMAHKSLADKTVKIDNEFDVEQNKMIGNENTIKLEGTIVSISKTITKKDNSKAKYIQISQENIYKGKKQDYTITVVMEDSFLKSYKTEVDQIKVGNKIRVTGKLVNYIDKDNNQRPIVNSYDLEVLDRKNKKDMEEEILR